MKGVEQIEQTIHNLRSPKRSHTFWGFLGVLALAFLLLWLKHNEWLGTPNEFMFGESPDGYKNYMTSTWHVRFDTSYVHYGGMSYPYGEHVLFTDNQPIVSAAMQWWSKNVSDLSGRTVGAINMLQLLSLMLGAGVIFLLLRKLHIPVWYAGPVALAILFMSPQNLRFDGHFGLSHTWVFPLLLLLLCRYEELYSRRYLSLQIGFLVWFAAQLHFYYFGLSALFLGLYTLIQLVFDPSLRNLRVRLSHLVVMVLLPFVLLNIWIHWSDYVTDRPANPWGFTTYIGYWEGVLLPYESFPLYQWIDHNIIKIRRVDGETQAYIGLAGTIFTVWLLFFRKLRPFEKDWEEAAYHRVHKRYLSGIFITALLLLIFSCGFPFAIKGMEWMVNYFGPLRQFRGLGRFTWAYFYVINVLLFYVLWNRSVRFKGFKNGQYLWFRWVIALAPLVLLSYEALFFQRSRKMALNSNFTERSVVAASPDHWLNKVDFSRFQALMPLPYYHVGSENIWLDIDGQHFRRVQTTALQTGLPDMGVFMSRTSIGHMVRSVQFASTPCESPKILEDLPDNRPIALMINASRWDEVKHKYRHLVDKAEPVYENAELRIMSLAPDSVRAYWREQALGVSAEMDERAVFSAGKNWRSSRDAGWLAYLSYDSLTTSDHIFQGTGAFQGNIGDTTWLWKSHIPKGDYALSLWIYVKQDMGMTDEVKIVQNSRVDGHEVNFKHEGLRFYMQSIVNGWALFDLAFTVYDDNSNTGIFLQKKAVDEPFFLDEVLIKRIDTDLYHKEPGWVARNNFWYKLPEGMQ
ncbi:MAG: hypothetical protein KA165_08455 [Saprospiraceae bacterium]|nr:hypothetical protein [Saprospiraceae bacterium]